MSPAIKRFFERHERSIGLGLMAMGFTIDTLTLKRIDLLFDNLVFVFYLTIAITAIVLTNAHQSGVLQNRFVDRYHVWLSLPMQYAFGGLFSGFVIIYSRSGTMVGSWLFLGLMAGLLVGNEFAKKYYVRLTFHLTIFYTALFSFFIFALPVLTGRMGAGMFLLSAAASLLAIGLLLAGLRRLSPAYVRQAGAKVLAAIGTVVAVYTTLYFTNIIPPVPLALKHIGVYHALIARPDYAADAEPAPWFRFDLDTASVFHRFRGEPVYVFASVFAPTRLRTPVVHRWSRFDERTRRWLVSDQLSYPISGGRDGGYRGYSQKQHVEDGRWRVEVVTSRGQLIGYVTFTVHSVTVPPSVRAVRL